MSTLPSPSRALKIASAALWFVAIITGVFYAFYEMGMLDKRSQPGSHAADLVTIKDFEAVNHVGETVEVRGTVSKVYVEREWVAITLGGEYLDCLLAGAVPAGSELFADSAFLRSLEDKEIGIVGMIKLSQAKPGIEVRTRDQLKIKWKTTKEDPIDHLNGVVNDRYREELGLFQPLNKTALRGFKTYLDQNVKDWQDKNDEDLWKFVPKFRQKTSD